MTASPPAPAPAPVNAKEQLKKEKDPLDALASLFQFSAANDYEGVDKTDLDFRWRWLGIYQQKPNNGHFMLRAKIPGGQLTPKQLVGLAEIARDHGRGFSDITTRQTFQYHWLTIDTLKPIFEKLIALGLASQFACGDCPRNMVSCPLAGVAKDEIIDSSKVVRDANAMFEAGGKEFSNLPRKFKPAIGGCGIHCHNPQMNDFGFFGVKRANGEAGYGLLVGGGLSDTPFFGKPMHVFVKPDQVVAVCRAIAIVFRDQGYREKRTRARLKFLVEDKGWEWTRNAIETVLGYKLEHDDSIGQPQHCGRDHTGVGEQKDGNYYVGIPVGRGRWTAQNMFDVAAIAAKYAVGEQRIRLTGKQNCVLLDIPKANVEKVLEELTNIGLPSEAHSLRSLLISCTGNEFCNLAVVETKHRSGRVLKYLEQHAYVDQPIAISFTGCPNACGQFQICDVGLRGTMASEPTMLDEKGKAKKVEGYDVYLGAGLGADPKFGERIAKQVIGDKIHLGLANLLNTYKKERIDDEETFRVWVGRSDPEYLRKLIIDPTLAADAVGLYA